MSSKLRKVLDEQIKKISLTSEEIKNLKKLADDFTKKIQSADKKSKVEIGGSLAKNTLIKKQKQDIDIFVVFKSEEETSNLEKILKKAKLTPKIIHGSRDYFKVYDNKNKIEFEIIPVVENKKPSEANNVTDVSLKHVKYVKSKLNKNKKLADEIKLAKAFCYACDCYGAESYIKGFSGYALEVLIINFGNFEKFLKKILNMQINKTAQIGWASSLASATAIKERRRAIQHKPTNGLRANCEMGKRAERAGLKEHSFIRKVIDPEKHFKNEKEALREINKSKLQSPFILVDPTFKYRNIVAGLSNETFQKFLNHSKEFLKNPSLKSFKKSDINKIIEKMKAQAKTKKQKFIEFEFETDRQEGDIAGTKMKKFFEFIIKNLQKKQQDIKQKEFFYNGDGQKAKGFISLKYNEQIEVKGPANYLRDAVKKFKKYNKKTYVKGDHVWKKEKVDLDEIFNSLKIFEQEIGVQFRIVNN